MSRLIWCCLFVFCNSAISQAQSLDWLSDEEKAELYPKQALETIDSAEAEVIFWVNAVRKYPKEYYERFVKPHFDTTDIASFYTNSLSKTLSKSEALPLLEHHPLLSEKASEHAEYMGKRGKYGHDGYTKRSNEILEYFAGTAENCNYAEPTPFRMVLSLLVDENVRNLGHRNTLLSQEYLYMGVAIYEHKEAEIQCVQEFGGEILE